MSQTIVVAPFSNSVMRDWPGAHFARMIGLLLAGSASDAVVRVIGTRGQRASAREIVRGQPSDRVLNDCGMEWDNVLAMLRSASCVIGNNSGIAHISGAYGVPTVCIFGGSHQRNEWRPLGERVVVLSRAIGCSPCHLDHNMTCIYDKLCLREITPEEVATVALKLMVLPVNGRDVGGLGQLVESGAAA